MTHLDRLARHEEKVVAAKELERQREQELAARTRELTALHAQRMEYERAVGGGADRDDELEARFAAELGDPDVRETRLTHGVAWIDRRAESRLAGAREARERAEEELRSFADAHLTALESELAAGVNRDVAAALKAASALRQALRPLHERELRASRLWTLAGRGRQVEFVAGSEHFDELRRAAARLERTVAVSQDTGKAAA